MNEQASSGAVARASGNGGRCGNERGGGAVVEIRISAGCYSIIVRRGGVVGLLVDGTDERPPEVRNSRRRDCWQAEGGAAQIGVWGGGRAQTRVERRQTRRTRRG